MLVLQLRKGIARGLHALARAVDGGSLDSPLTRSPDSTAPGIDVSDAPAHWVDRIRDAGLLEPGAAGRWQGVAGPPGHQRGTRTPVAPPTTTTDGRGFDPSPARRESSPAKTTTPEPARQEPRKPVADEPRTRRLSIRGDPGAPAVRRSAPITTSTDTTRPAAARNASQDAELGTPDRPTQAAAAPASRRLVSPESDRRTGRLRLRVPSPTQPRKHATDVGSAEAEAAAVEPRVAGQGATEITATSNVATDGSRTNAAGVVQAPRDRAFRADSPSSCPDRSPRRRDAGVVSEPTPTKPFSRARTAIPELSPTTRSHAGDVSPRIPPRPPIPAPWPELPATARTRDPEADVALFERELARRARWTAERNAV